jgi:hypothetical protein
MFRHALVHQQLPKSLDLMKANQRNVESILSINCNGNELNQLRRKRSNRRAEFVQFLRVTKGEDLQDSV